MKRSHKLGLFALGLAGAASVIALIATAAPESVKLAGTRVDNFMLPDQTGMGHELLLLQERRRPWSSSPPRWATTRPRKPPPNSPSSRRSTKAKGVHFVMLNSSLRRQP